MSSLQHRWSARPWLMKVTLAYFKKRLRTQQALPNRVKDNALPEQLAQMELIERLKFAAQYGQPANAAQRAWCFEVIEQDGIAQADAEYLIWSGTINFRHKKIIFSRWDQMLGYLMMYPVLLLFSQTIPIAINTHLSPEAKLIMVLAYLAISLGAWQFFKSTTFDLYRIGLRYFHPGGWRVLQRDYDIFIK